MRGNLHYVSINPAPRRQRPDYMRGVAWLLASFLLLIVLLTLTVPARAETGSSGFSAQAAAAVSSASGSVSR